MRSAFFVEAYVYHVICIVLTFLYFSAFLGKDVLRKKKDFLSEVNYVESCISSTLKRW
jgi:hypothetical protein